MKLLIKHERSLPNPNKPYVKDGKTLTWDNVNLYCAELDRYGMGLVIPGDHSKMVVKIRYSDFEEITGYSYEEFCELYEDNFFGHEISVWGEDVFNKFVPRKVKIEDKCYVSYTAEAAEYFKSNKERKASGQSDLVQF